MLPLAREPIGLSGIKFNNVDVSVEPEGFYFVSKNGGEAQPVDLYYHTTNQKYIKILKQILAKNHFI